MASIAWDGAARIRPPTKRRSARLV